MKRLYIGTSILKYLLLTALATITYIYICMYFGFVDAQSQKYVLKYKINNISYVAVENGEELILVNNNNHHYDFTLISKDKLTSTLYKEKNYCFKEENFIPFSELINLFFNDREYFREKKPVCPNGLESVY